MLRKLLAAMAGLFAAAPVASQGATPRPEVLLGAFSPGFVGEAGEKRYPVRTVRVGDVRIASGKVLLVDPFIVGVHDKPPSVDVRPGTYRVDLAVADTGSSGYRVAFARLTLADRPPVRWSMAVGADQLPTPLRPDEILGYPVDAGTGAFMDSSIPAWLDKTFPPERLDDLEKLTDGWISRGEAEGGRLGVPHLFALIDEVGGGGVAMFSSGWGDGVYASWIGHDAAGEPVVIVTDFAVIDAVNLPSAAAR